MKTLAFFCVALAGVATVKAQVQQYPLDPAPYPAPYPAPVPGPGVPAPMPAMNPPVSTPDPGPWTPIWVNLDEVQSFKEPKAVTISEIAAVRYKPLLHVHHGCHPHPAVDKDGRTSEGYAPVGTTPERCWIRFKGSQVYGRSIWFRGVWAIMYAWYFPKNLQPTGVGHRHDWESAVVWLNNPAVANPQIMGVSASDHDVYKSEVPPKPSHMDGTRVQLMYYYPEQSHHTLKFTDFDGETQPLIMWEQLPENARRALNSVDYGAVKMPLNDANFQSNLGKAWPFGGEW